MDFKRINGIRKMNGLKPISESKLARYETLTDLIFWKIDEVSKGNYAKRDKINKVFERLSNGKYSVV